MTEPDAKIEIEQYKQAIEGDPDNAYSHHHNWGLILHRLKRYDDAIAQYQQALEQKPDYADAYNNWGRALEQLAKYEEVIE